MKLSEYIKLEIKAVDYWARNFLINLMPDLWIINNLVRPALARLCGMKCASKVVLQKGIFYGNPRNIEIGDRSVICRDCFLDGQDKIKIGSNVAIAFGSVFVTSNHEIGSKEKRTGKLVGGPITIGDGVWIAARVTVAPGVEIGEGSVISVGSILMHSIPPNSLVSGVPGKVVTQLGNGISSSQIVDLADTSEAVSEQKDQPVETELKIAGSVNGAMTKEKFYAALESLLDVPSGSIKGTESLGDLPWNSMTILAFIAMADSELHEVASPAVLADCRTVADLVNLFPEKIK